MSKKTQHNKYCCIANKEGFALRLMVLVLWFSLRGATSSLAQPVNPADLFYAQTEYAAKTNSYTASSLSSFVVYSQSCNKTHLFSRSGEDINGLYQESATFCAVTQASAVGDSAVATLFLPGLSDCSAARAFTTNSGDTLRSAAGNYCVEQKVFEHAGTKLDTVLGLSVSDCASTDTSALGSQSRNDLFLASSSYDAILQSFTPSTFTESGIYSEVCTQAVLFAYEGEPLSNLYVPSLTFCAVTDASPVGDSAVDALFLASVSDCSDTRTFTENGLDNIRFDAGYYCAQQKVFEQAGTKLDTVRQPSVSDCASTDTSMKGAQLLDTLFLESTSYDAAMHSFTSSTFTENVMYSEVCTQAVLFAYEGEPLSSLFVPSLSFCAVTDASPVGDSAVDALFLASLPDCSDTRTFTEDGLDNIRFDAGYYCAQQKVFEQAGTKLDTVRQPSVSDCASTDTSVQGSQSRNDLFLASSDYNSFTHSFTPTIFTGSVMYSEVCTQAPLFAYQGETLSNLYVPSLTSCALTDASQVGPNNIGDLYLPGLGDCSGTRAFGAGLADSVFVESNYCITTSLFARGGAKLDTVISLATGDCAEVLLSPTVQISYTGYRKDYEALFTPLHNYLPASADVPIDLCERDTILWLVAEANFPSTWIWKDKDTEDTLRNTSLVYDDTYRTNRDTLFIHRMTVDSVAARRYVAIAGAIGNVATRVIAPEVCNCLIFKDVDSGDTIIYAYTKTLLSLHSRIIEHEKNKYQWYDTAGPIPSLGTGIAYTLNTGAIPRIGKYWNHVVTPCDTVNSDTITLVVCDTLSLNAATFTATGDFIADQPHNLRLHDTLNVCEGDSLQMSLVLAGAVNYQWYRNDSLLNRDTNISLLVLPSLAAGDTGIYRVEASNNCFDTMKLSMWLNINLPLTPVDSLADSTVICEFDTLYLHYSVANEVNGYKWYRDSVVADSQICFTRDTVFVIPDIAKEQEGIYIVETQSACGILRDTIYIEVLQAAQIAVSPRDTMICEGTPFTLFSNAVHADSFEWYREGVWVSDSADYTVDSMTAADTGTYILVAHNKLCNTVTDTVHVGLIPYLEIATPLHDADTLYICEGDSLGLTYVVLNADSIEWYKLDGSFDTVVGATDSIYSIHLMTLTDSGYYVARAFSSCFELSDTVYVHVQGLPKILVKPVADTFLCYTGSVDLIVEVNEFADSLQWYLNGEMLPDASTDTLHVTDVSYLDTGVYMVLAYNSSGLSCSLDTAYAHISLYDTIVANGFEDALNDTVLYIEFNTLTLSYNATGVDSFVFIRVDTVLQKGISNVYEKLNADESDTGMYVVKLIPEGGCREIFDTIYTAMLSTLSVVDQPTGMQFCIGDTGMLIAKAVYADSAAWYREDGTFVQGHSKTIAIQQPDTLRLTTMEDSGRYYYVAWNSILATSDTSDTVHVSVDSAMRVLNALHSKDTMYFCDGADSLTLIYSVAHAKGYRWYKNDTLLEEATDTLFTLYNLTADSAAVYVVEAYNNCSVVSDTVYVHVRGLPQIVVKPTADTTLCYGGAIDLVAEVNEFADSLQWYLNGDLLVDSTDISLHITNVTYLDTGYYMMIARSKDTLSCGADTLLTHIGIFDTLAWNGFVEAVDDTILCYEYATLNLSYDATGVDTFVWYRADTVLHKDVLPNYELTGVVGDDTGVYVIQLIGKGGCSEFYDTVYVKMASELVIVNQPESVQLCIGGSGVLVALSVNADSAAWYKSLDGSFVESYAKLVTQQKPDTLNVESTGDSVGYYYMAWNRMSGKSVTSDTVYVSDKPVMVVTDSLYAQDTMPFCDGADSLVLTYKVAHAKYYRWYKNGDLLAGVDSTTDTTFTLYNLTADSAAEYVVEAYDNCEIVSDTVYLSVLPDLEILTPLPDTLRLCESDSLGLTYMAVRADSIEWHKLLDDGSDTLLQTDKIATDDTIRSTYSIPVTVLADSGYYMVRTFGTCRKLADTVYVIVRGLPNVVRVAPTEDTTLVCPGSPIDLVAEVKFADSLQWYFNGALLPDSTNAQLHIESVTDEYTGDYMLIVLAKDGLSCKADTLTVHLGVYDTIVAAGFEDAVNDTIVYYEYSDLKLVYNATGVDTFVFIKNDIEIQKDTAHIYTKPGADISDTGIYVVKLVSACGEEIYDTVYARMSDKLIVEQPVDIQVCIGDTGTLIAIVSNADSAAWYREDGTFVKGHSLDPTMLVSDTLLIITMEDSGSYYYMAWNSLLGVSDTSDVVHASIDSAVRAIEALPASDVPQVFCQGDSLGMTYVVLHADSVEWRKLLEDGSDTLLQTDVAVNDSVHSVYSIPAIALADSGYYVVHTFGKCRELSDTVYVQVRGLPEIIVEPTEDTTVCYGNPISLIAEVNEFADSLQWYLNGNILPDSTNAQLHIASVSYSDTGYYMLIALSKDGLSCKADTTHARVSVYDTIVAVGFEGAVDDTITFTGGGNLILSYEATGVDTFVFIKEDIEIQKGTAYIYTKSGATILDTGIYVVKLVSACGDELYDTVYAKMIDALSIVEQPIGTTQVCSVNDSAELIVKAVNADSAAWYRLDEPLPIKTYSKEFSTATFDTLRTDTGTYYYVAWNSDADTSVSSDTVRIILSPAMQVLDSLSEHDTLTFCNGAESLVLKYKVAEAQYYRWYKNGELLAGVDSTTDTTLVLHNLTADSVATYVVKAHNKCDTVSDTVYLSMVPELEFVTRLSDNDAVVNDTLHICQGDSLGLTYVVLGADSIEWYKLDGSFDTILVATDSVYSIRLLALTDSGYYVARAFGLINDCAYELSDTVYVHVHGLPEVIVEPTEDTTVCYGTPISLIAEVNEFADSLQWYLNGNILLDSTNAQLHIASVSYLDTGTYMLIALSKDGLSCKADTTHARVGVYDTIVANGFEGAVDDTITFTGGGTLNLSYEATGVDTFVFIKDDSEIQKGTAYIYTKSGATILDTGIYVVKLMSACGDENYDTVYAKMIDALSIVEQPIRTTVCSVNDSAELVVKAVNADSAAWYRLDEPLPIKTYHKEFSTATFDTLRTDTGTYYYVAWNSDADTSVSSDTVRIILSPAMQVIDSLSEHDTLTFCNGAESLELKYKVAGAEYYRWYKNGELLAGVDSTTDTTFVLHNLTADSAATYVVKAHNKCDTLSDTVYLSMVPELEFVTRLSDNDAVVNDTLHICQGDSLGLTYVVLGADSIEWYKLDGGFDTTIVATDSVYSIRSLALTDSGYYVARAFGLINDCAYELSDTVYVHVRGLPEILVEPTEDTTVCYGTSISLIAEVNEFADSLQWYLNGDILTDSTNAQLHIASVSYLDTGTYMLIVLSKDGLSCKADTTHARVGVYDTIVANGFEGAVDDTITFTGGGNLILSYEATGVDTFVFIIDDIEIQKDTAHIYTKSGATILDTGVYVVKLMSACGEELYDTVYAKMIDALSIVEQPIRTTQVCSVNDSAELVVKAVNADSAAWYRLDEPLPIKTYTKEFSTATFDTLRTDTGTYYYVAWNSDADTSVSSDTVRIILSPAMQVIDSLSEHDTLTFCNGAESLELKYKVAGAEYYRWYKNGELLAGVDSTIDTTLVLHNLTADSAATYVVKAHNKCDTLSDTVYLSMVPELEFVIRLSDNDAVVNDTLHICQGDSLGLTYVVLGADSIEWYKLDGSFDTTIVATDSVYSIRSLALTDSGYYVARAFGLINDCAYELSDTVYVHVRELPKILVKPMEDTTVCYNEPISLIAEVNEFADSLQWYLNGNILPDSTNAQLHIASVSYSDTGTYMLIALSKDGLSCKADTTHARVGVYDTIVAVGFEGAVDDTITFTDGGTLNLSYEATGVDTFVFIKDDIEIQKDTAHIYTKSGADILDTGVYVVKLIPYGGCDPVFDTVYAEMLGTLSIVAQPADIVDMCIGTTGMLIATAIHADSAAWYRGEDGTFVRGYHKIETIQQPDTLLLTEITDSGYYYYVAWNSVLATSDTSDTVHVSVLPQLELLTALADRDTLDFCEGDSLGLTYVVRNADSIAWYKNGTLDTTFAATDSVFSIRTLAITDSGYYVARAFGVSCYELSDTVYVNVVPALKITTYLHSSDTLDICDSSSLALTYGVANADSIEWRKLGADFSPVFDTTTVATDNVYSISVATFADSGYYVARAFANNTCFDVSDTVYVRVHGLPKVVRLTPTTADTIVSQGSAIDIIAEGNEFADSLQWYRNGNILADSTNLSLHIVASAETGDTGVYMLLARNRNMPSCKTDTVRVHVEVVSQLEVIDSLADTSHLCEGGSLGLKYVVLGADSIKWYKLLPGGSDTLLHASAGTSSAYSNAAIALADSGNYVVMAFNIFDTVSDTIYVRVHGLPRVFVAPTADTTVCYGTSIDLIVRVNNFADSLQWWNNDTAVMLPCTTTNDADTTIVTLHIASVDHSNIGVYKLIALNKGGLLDSLFCREVVEIKLGVYDTIAANGFVEVSESKLSAGGDTIAFYESYALTLSYDATGVDTFVFIRLADNVVLQRSPDNTYTKMWKNEMGDDEPAPVDAADAGIYVVRLMSQGGCKDVSDTVYVKVYKKPVITFLPPTTVPMCEGRAFELVAQAENADSAAWYKLDDEEGYQLVFIEYKDSSTRTDIFHKDTVTEADTGIYIYMAWNDKPGHSADPLSSAVGAHSVQVVIINRPKIITRPSVDTFALKDLPMELPMVAKDVEWYQWFFTAIEDTSYTPLDIHTVHPDSVAYENKVSYSAQYMVSKSEDEGYYYVELHNRCDVIIGDTIHVEVTGRADVSIKKTVRYSGFEDKGFEDKDLASDLSISTLVPQNVIYTIVVENIENPVVGEDCRDVIIYDTIPPASSLVSSTLRPNNAVEYEWTNTDVTDPPVLIEHGDNTFEYHIESLMGKLPRGEIITLEVTVKMKGEGFFVTGASVTTANYEEAEDTLNNYSRDPGVLVSRKIVEYTTITPNGDGINDHFVLRLAMMYPDNEIYIYNRAGNLVFNRKGYTDQFSATGLPEGTYYYVLLYKDDTGKQQKFGGFITVIRVQ